MLINRKPQPQGKTNGLSLKITTWNVNSLTARHDRAQAWLGANQSDVLCLQELKLETHKFPHDTFEALGYRAAVHPPMIHNLVKISQSWGMELSIELHYKLAEITTFNIGTRYDDFKKSFYQRCTKEFTSNWIKEIKSIRQWIKEEHLK